jgi:hypothetical protein
MLGAAARTREQFNQPDFRECMEKNASGKPPLEGAPSRHLLETLAANRIRSGLLPRVNTGQLVAGHGQDRPCSVCDSPIDAAEVEYEVVGSPGGAARYLFLHIECYHAWTAACRKVAPDPEPR